MKLRCTEPGCGAVIQMADTDQELLKKRMEDHVQREHSTLQVKHEKTLQACRESFAAIMAGQRVTSKRAQFLHDAVSDLLGKPYAVQKEMKDANDPNPDAGQPSLAGQTNAGKIVSGPEILPSTDSDGGIRDAVRQPELDPASES